MEHTADPPNLKTSEHQGDQTKLDLSPVQVVHHRLVAHRSAPTAIESPTIVFQTIALRALSRSRKGGRILWRLTAGGIHYRHSCRELLALAQYLGDPLPANFIVGGQ